MHITHCLASAPAQGPLAIRFIPFDTLRASGASRGVHVGDRVHRRSTTAAGPVVLETLGGGHVALPLEYAALIECEPMAAD